MTDPLVIVYGKVCQPCVDLRPCRSEVTYHWQADLDFVYVDYVVSPTNFVKFERKMSTSSDYSDSEQSDGGSGGKADVGDLGLSILDIPTGNDSSPPLSPAKKHSSDDTQ